METHDDFLKVQEILGKRLPNDVQMGALMLGNFTLAPLVAPLAPQTVAKMLKK